MQTIDIEDHDFRKVNLVSLKNGGDTYRCALCGCEGWRRPFTRQIEVSEQQFKKGLKCSHVKPQAPVKEKTKSVVLEQMRFVGIEAGTHEVVECPDEYKSKNYDGVWVYSESRKEPVRILPHEIKAYL